MLDAADYEFTYEFETPTPEPTIALAPPPESTRSMHMLIARQIVAMTPSLQDVCLVPTEVEIWEQYSTSFPNSGTMRSGSLYRQMHWGPITGAIGYGLLPTPAASDLKSKSGKGVGQYKTGGFYRQTSKGKSCARLGDALAYLDRPDLATSPGFREEMMGYPEGWTLLKD